MKIHQYLRIFCVVLFIGAVCGCVQYPPYEVSNPPFVNKTSLNMYVGDKTQLTASPVDADFTWTSDDETVAKVDGTGLVEAVGEGLTSIFVASDNDRIKIDLTVKTFMPLTDINVSTPTVEMFVNNKVMVPVYPVPENASEPPVFTWVSRDSDIAAVDNTGTITGIAEGNTVVTVSGGGFTKTIAVKVSVNASVALLDKTAWTIEVSDEGNGRKAEILDGNVDIPNFWECNAVAWVIIDMKSPVLVSKIVTVRGRKWGNSHTKTLQYFIGSDPNPDASTWTSIATGAYAGEGGTGVLEDETLSLDVDTGVTGQYLKLLLDDSIWQQYHQICEIDVWGIQ